MSLNKNEVNIPINSEKRDPLYGRSKADIGLSKVPNMSFDEVETSILANVKNTVDEGVAYNYSNFASEEDPISANIVKLKPNSARTVLHFSLGTWSETSDFISRETATLELWSNKNNISYNLFVTEVFPKVSKPEGSIDRSTPLTSTKVTLKEFKTGGWLVTLHVTDRAIDAIWINLVESKNVDAQNPLENIYSDDDFGRVVEFYCDKSIISSELSLNMPDLLAAGLSHDIPVKTSSVDPSDYYNSQSNTYSLTNIDLSGIIGTDDLIKSKSLVSIPIKTDKESCKVDQYIPLSVNRLNHQIKFRLTGKSLHSEQEVSWREAQSNQGNLTAFLDTDPEATNYFPISISELTHDINITTGKGLYRGSIPESGQAGGSGYNRYSFEDGKVNYVTFQNKATGMDEYSVFDSNTRKWTFTSRTLSTPDKCKSLSTKSDEINEVNMIVHGVDHDINLEVVNLQYRADRGSATDENGLLEDDRKLTAGIQNLTWQDDESLEDEKRKYSYATGSIKLNTFEKDYYQALDLTVHGLDHNIKFEGYRTETHVLLGPSQSDLDKSNRYRPGSNGKDINGVVSLDTFTGRTQKFNLEVIDSRYTDCARGLAIKIDGNYMSHSLIDDNGTYGNYLPNTPSADEILEIYPTINGVPFTGDFRHQIKYPPEMERDHLSKIHDARNITVRALHPDIDRKGSGEHKWEVLCTLRKASYDVLGKVSSPVAEIIDSYDLDSNKYLRNGYGLVKLANSDESKLDGNSNSDEKIRSYMSLFGDDDGVISVKVFKNVVNELISYVDNIRNTYKLNS